MVVLEGHCCEVGNVLVTVLAHILELGHELTIHNTGIYQGFVLLNNTGHTELHIGHLVSAGDHQCWNDFLRNLIFLKDGHN